MDHRVNRGILLMPNRDDRFTVVALQVGSDGLDHLLDLFVGQETLRGRLAAAHRGFEGERERQHLLAANRKPVVR